MIKRVLIVGFTYNYGGMETYIMQLYRHIDRKKLQFDFLSFEGYDIAFREEVLRLGGKIFYVPIVRKGIIEHYTKLDKIFHSLQYAGVYYQANHKLQSLDVFRYAKKYNVPLRVLHSHNSTEEKVSTLIKIRQLIVEKKLNSFVNYRFACSEDAGKWMFGNRKFFVIKNSVDANVYTYDVSKREKTRREMGITDQLVIGTVGRLAPAKNPEYIVEIFKKLHDSNSNTIFIHVGSGELEDSIREKIKVKGLEESFLLMGIKQNVQDYLNAMDIFVLPSLHEGFPMVLVEAQLTGLPCIVADNIPKSCNLTGNVSYLPLCEDVSVWTDKIMATDITERKAQKDIICKKGYDIDSVAKKIQKFFVDKSEK